MKRLIALLLALIMLLTLLPQITPSANAYVVQSGYCGENLSYVLNYATLTISGEGPMYNYSRDNPAPWDNFALDITHIFIEDGVTTIGDYAFGNTYYYVQEIQIPDSVTYIGYSAFDGCSNLENIKIPFLGNTADETASLSSFFGRQLKTVVITGGSKIGSYAFSDCANLTSIQLPESITGIGEYAFEGCTGLTNISIPESVTDIANNAFKGCINLNSVTFLNAVGWQVKKGNDEVFLKSSLSSPGMAAKYLREQYCSYTWTRDADKYDDIDIEHDFENNIDNWEELT